MIKYFSVAKFYKKLFENLKKRYGASEAYTSGQIKRTVDECKFNKKYLCYAYALFLEKKDFFEVMEKEFTNKNAEKVREYIAKRYFNGNLNYTFKKNVLEKVGNSAHDSIGAGSDGD